MKLKVGLSKTVNLGDYENARPHAEIVQKAEKVEGDNLEEKYENLRNEVRREVEKECAEYKQRRSNKE